MKLQMARICFDMDGTITEGRYLKPPRTRAAYMSLAPYDNDTIDILSDICREHEVFIITARSEPGNQHNIIDWLNYQAGVDRIRPTGVITGIEQSEKFKLAQLLKCDLMFDDSPIVWESHYTEYHPKRYLMDNPQWEKNQQIVTTKRIRSWKEISEILNNQTVHSRTA